MRRILLLLALCSSLGAVTVTGVTVSPHGVFLQVGSTYQLSVVCTYTAPTPSDDCTAAGGATWTIEPNTPSSNTVTGDQTVSASGLVTAVADPISRTCSGATCTYLSADVIARVGSFFDVAREFTQHVGDLWTFYTTPDLSSSSWATKDNLTVGAVGAIGAGFMVNSTGSGGAAVPVKSACDWTSSNTAVATVQNSSTQGDYVTGVAAGAATLTCPDYSNGNAVWQNSALSGWVAPGNTLSITVTAGGAGGHTWYVRPDGGTLFSSTDASGQCDGQHDAPYPGTGTDQPCGVSTLRNLWADGVRSCSLSCLQWVITGGDTVIVEPNGTTGYLINAAANAGSAASCEGVGQPSLSLCVMPPIPSGTSIAHTIIEGSQFSNCSSDSQKTQLWMSWGGYIGFEMAGSSFVDIRCFNLSDQAACGGGGFTHTCSGLSSGTIGFRWNALSSNDTFTDVAVHGLAAKAFWGAPGKSITLNRVRASDNPTAGIDMDDAPWGHGNYSVAGGFTLTNSTVELNGCVEEYPVIHNYPVIECRSDNSSGYGDGLGTGSDEGFWTFTGDIFRYNTQDGLDLLHSGLYSLDVEDSISYGNEGATFKVGSAANVKFVNNVAIGSCSRLGQQLGDMPAGAMSPAQDYCRSNDTLEVQVDPNGSDTIENNTIVSYFSVGLDETCDGTDCTGASTTFENNVFLSYQNTAGVCGGTCTNAGVYTGELYQNPAATYPGNNGWATRDYNYFINDKNCPIPLAAHETCTTDPKFANEPLTGTWKITAESQLDPLDVRITAASPLDGAGVTIAGITTDIAGQTRPAPPSIGSLEVGAASPYPPAVLGGSGSPPASQHHRPFNHLIMSSISGPRCESGN